MASCDLCISYEDSLRALRLEDHAIAYGQRGGECKTCWSIGHRESWISSLKIAQDWLQRYVGMALCPQEICDEAHYIGKNIYLNQKPVAYLGTRTYSDWTEETLVQDEPNKQWYVDICDSELAAAGITDVSRITFSYPDSVLNIYRGSMCLPQPIVTRLIGTDCDATEPGYRFSWFNYWLVHPVNNVDCPLVPTLISTVQWQSWEITANSAYSLVGGCDCLSCNGGTPNLTVTLVDWQEGVVCVTADGCSNNFLRVRINYATAFDCTGVMASDLREALTLLAVVVNWPEAYKPCGCNPEYIDGLLKVDPGSEGVPAYALPFGSTVAGVRVMHIMNNLLKRPKFNQPGEDGGGLLTGSTVRSARGRSQFHFYN